MGISSIGVNLAATATYDTTKNGNGALHVVGAEYENYDGTRWVYVQASHAIAKYDVVWVDTAGIATSITDALARSAGRPAVASQVAFTDLDFGWVQFHGKATISVKSACAADKPLFTSATAGALDDATLSTSQVQVQGVILQSAEAASVASAFLSYPLIRRLEV